MPFEQLDFLGVEAKRAFLDMAGNFDKSLSTNMLIAWQRNLEGTDPVDIAIACRRCMKDGDVPHFPRFAEFAKKLPAKRAAMSVDPETAFWWSPSGDGEFRGNVECVPEPRRQEEAEFIWRVCHGNPTRAQSLTIEKFVPGFEADNRRARQLTLEAV